MAKKESRSKPSPVNFSCTCNSISRGLPIAALMKKLGQYLSFHLIKQEITDYADRLFYIIGPQHMVDAIVDMLKTLGLPNEHMKIELFSGYQ
jgi:ferredoxin-NADP reductase